MRAVKNDQVSSFLIDNGSENFPYQSGVFRFYRDTGFVEIELWEGQREQRLLAHREVIDLIYHALREEEFSGPVE